MKTKYAVALSLILLAVSLRVLPHPANFAPMGAVAIFAGAVLPRKTALWISLLAIVISDAIIGFYDMMPVTWVCFGLIALASSTWLKKPTFVKGVVVTVSSSLFFFIVTNFAVWVQSGMYAHTWRGIAECFTMALPFFRNTVASDLFYTAVLFGVFAFATHAQTRKQVA
jgi:hypothetical protein